MRISMEAAAQKQEFRANISQSISAWQSTGAAANVYKGDSYSQELDSNGDRDRMALSEKTVINAIEKANNAMKGTNTQLEFSVHEKTKQIMVKVIDSNTKEVVREIPSEKILDMVYNMMELAGIFVDTKK